MSRGIFHICQTSKEIDGFNTNVMWHARCSSIRTRWCCFDVLLSLWHCLHAPHTTNATSRPLFSAHQNISNGKHLRYEMCVVVLFSPAPSCLSGENKLKKFWTPHHTHTKKIMKNNMQSRRWCVMHRRISRAICRTRTARNRSSLRARGDFRPVYVFKFKMCFFFCFYAYSTRRHRKVTKRRKCFFLRVYFLFICRSGNLTQLCAV